MPIVQFVCQLCDIVIRYTTNEQLLYEERTGAKFQNDISKTEGLVRLYRGGHSQIASARHTDHHILYIYIYFIGSLMFPFGC